MYDTIFSPITLTGPSAISVFRVSGENSGVILKLLTKSKDLPKERRQILKKIYNPAFKEEVLDICLICWMPKPNSFTGEDSFEISCHGGDSTSFAFIEVLSKIEGLRFADAGEFSQRALINGKLDLVEAEAINDIILAETEKQRLLSIKQLSKGLSIPINFWRKEMINVLSKVEATIDFSDEESIPDKVYFKEDLEKLIFQIKEVLNEGDKVDLISNGTKVALTGAPNTGKSSLFNYIIKTQKSIVTNIPGTTRDVVEKKVNYKGYQIIFSDTAGIRKTKDLVEKEGIKKAIKEIEAADIVLNIYDVTELEEKEKSSFWNIYNKIDKIKDNTLKEKLAGKNSFFLSAKTGEGVGQLIEAIYENILIRTKEGGKEGYFYSNKRQRNNLEKVVVELKSAINENSEEIIAEHLRSAIYNLERVLGKVDIEEVLGNIFSKFCIGK